MWDAAVVRVAVIVIMPARVIVTICVVVLFVLANDRIARRHDCSCVAKCRDDLGNPGSEIVPIAVSDVHSPCCDRDRYIGNAVDAANGIVYANTSRDVHRVTLFPAEDFEAMKAAHPGKEVAPQKGAPFGMMRETVLSPLGMPCNAPPWGTLTALDLKTRRVLFDVPLEVSRERHVKQAKGWRHRHERRFGERRPRVGKAVQPRVVRQIAEEVLEESIGGRMDVRPGSSRIEEHRNSEQRAEERDGQEADESQSSVHAPSVPPFL